MGRRFGTLVLMTNFAKIEMKNQISSASIKSNKTTMSSIQLLKRNPVVFIRSKNLPQDVLDYVSDYLPKMVSPFKQELAFFHHQWTSFKNLMAIGLDSDAWTDPQLRRAVNDWTGRVCEGMNVSNTYYSRALAHFTFQYDEIDVDMDTEVWNGDDEDEDEAFTRADQIKEHLRDCNTSANYLLKQAKKPFCPKCQLVRGDLPQSDGTSWCLQCLTEFILH